WCRSCDSGSAGRSTCRNPRVRSSRAPGSCDVDTHVPDGVFLAVEHVDVAAAEYRIVDGDVADRSARFRLFAHRLALRGHFRRRRRYRTYTRSYQLRRTFHAFTTDVRNVYEE